jgi:adenylate cyclase
MRASLRVRTGRGEPFEVEVGNTATIGRSRDNTVSLAGCPQVSRQHAIIRCHNAFQYQVMDLGSRNGTFLDGRRVITPCTLHHGARIRIADCEILFEHHETTEGEAGYDATLASGTDSIGQQIAKSSILVCDIRGFSTMSEKLEESVLARLLGEWFRDAGNMVQKAGGTIDKFLGDAVLAYWMNPASEPGATEALAVAEDLLAMAAGRRWPESDRPFRIAIALHYGVVTCGNIGLVAQRDATIIGDAVNTVFRMESLMKQLGQKLVASADFLSQLPGQPPDFSDLGEHQLKGKNHPVRLFGRA